MMASPDRSSDGVSLCAECRGQQFWDTLSGQRTKGVTRDFNVLWKNRSCPVCELLRQTISRAYDVDQILRQFRNRRGTILCHLQRHGAPTDLYLQDADVQRFFQLEVRLRHKSNRHRRIYSKDSMDWKKRLDIKCILPTSTNPQKEYTMVRKEVGTCLDINELKRWLHECDTEHSREANHWSVSTGELQLEKLAKTGCFRVIDVRTGQIVPMWNLDRYCTLSYVWGTSMNQYAASHGFAETTAPCQFPLDLSDRWESLPRTIRDSITLIQGIGERYLWIDAFCIDHSNSNVKEAVISNMGSIYAQSYLTIVAAGGADADAGLPRLQSQAVPERSVRVERGRKYTSLAPARQTLHEALNGTVWASRAWTFQERMMSSRSVIFTATDVIFDCSHREYREAFELTSLSECNYGAAPSKAVCPYDKRRSHYGKNKSLHSKLLTPTALSSQDYFAFLKQYTGRRLTYPGDRLDAFRAVLSKFHMPTSNYAQSFAESGIPVQFMDVGLCWGIPRSGQIRERIQKDTGCTRNFPSWSWIGWTGCIRPYTKTITRVEQKPRFEVKDKHNIVAFPDVEWLSSPYITVWHPWLRGEPKLCKSNAHVTIHLRVTTIATHLVLQSKAAPGRMTRARAFSISEPEIQVGHVDIDPALLLDDHQKFEIIVWTCDVTHCSGEGILTQSRDGVFFERVTPTTVTLSWPSHSTWRFRDSKYVRLR